MSIACVIGNGPSRKSLDLQKINESMMTYGCNALYRDFLPDYLISMDNYMVNDILANNIHHVCKLYTQHSNRFDELAQLEPIYFVKTYPKTYDSGNAAVELAASKHKTVYMIGFDYNDGYSSMPNVYQHTQNYHGDVYHSADTTAMSWKQRLSKTLKTYTDTKFIRVTDKSIDMYQDNYSEISLQQFKEIYESTN